MKLITKSIAADPRFRSKLKAALDKRIKATRFTCNDPACVDGEARVSRTDFVSTPDIQEISAGEGAAVLVKGNIRVEVVVMYRVHTSDRESDKLETRNETCRFLAEATGDERLSCNPGDEFFDALGVEIRQCDL